MQTGEVTTGAVGPRVEELDEGRLIEELNEAFMQAAKDIDDPNKAEGAKRAVTLKLTLVPNAVNSGFELRYQVAKTLAPRAAGKTYCELDNQLGGVTIVRERNYQQQSLNMETASNE